MECRHLARLATNVERLILVVRRRCKNVDADVRYQLRARSLHRAFVTGVALSSNGRGGSRGGTVRSTRFGSTTRTVGVVPVPVSVSFSVSFSVSASIAGDPTRPGGAGGTLRVPSTGGTV